MARPFRRLERAVVGFFIGVLVWFVERRVMKALRRSG